MVEDSVFSVLSSPPISAVMQVFVSGSQTSVHLFVQDDSHVAFGEMRSGALSSFLAVPAIAVKCMQSILTAALTCIICF